MSPKQFGSLEDDEQLFMMLAWNALNEKTKKPKGSKDKQLGGTIKNASDIRNLRARQGEG